MSVVQYRDVVGHPGYRVGDDGSVWSQRWYHGSTEWRPLAPRPTKSGYLLVALFDGTGRVDRGVHTLMLEAFVGPCPEGMECRHFPDRDPASNRLANLQWGTRLENAADKRVHGTIGGWTLSAETRARMSASRKGMKKSPEAIAKVAAALRGRTLSDEMRAKLSAAHMGKRPSAATRAKMSASHKRRFAALREGATP